MERSFGCLQKQAEKTLARSDFSIQYKFCQVSPPKRRMIQCPADCSWINENRCKRCLTTFVMLSGISPAAVKCSYLILVQSLAPKPKQCSRHSTRAPSQALRNT